MLEDNYSAQCLRNNTVDEEMNIITMGSRINWLRYLHFIMITATL